MDPPLVHGSCVNLRVQLQSRKSQTQLHPWIKLCVCWATSRATWLPAVGQMHTDLHWVQHMAEPGAPCGSLQAPSLCIYFSGFKNPITDEAILAPKGKVTFLVSYSSEWRSRCSNLKAKAGLLVEEHTASHSHSTSITGFRVWVSSNTQLNHFCRVPGHTCRDATPREETGVSDEKNWDKWTGKTQTWIFTFIK